MVLYDNHNVIIEDGINNYCVYYIFLMRLLKYLTVVNISGISFNTLSANAVPVKLNWINLFGSLFKILAIYWFYNPDSVIMTTC